MYVKYFVPFNGNLVTRWGCPRATKIKNFMSNNVQGRTIPLVLQPWLVVLHEARTSRSTCNTFFLVFTIPMIKRTSRCCFYGMNQSFLSTQPSFILCYMWYYRYNILPMSDINFGCLLVNSKKTRTFIIENKGEFDFKYQISKMVKEPTQQPGTRSTRP